MKREEIADLISIAQAAKIRGVTIEAISDLIRRGRLTVVEIADKRFLKRSEVESFRPSKGGRPKAAGTKKGQKK